ncbi:MAG: hypothetical protein F4082_02410 [Gammaproteobacteria bacterium]|nr:hypothetical protein [Gammaproteobacteria bacterium]
MQRRSFLKLSAAAGAIYAYSGRTPSLASDSEPRIQRYVPLGSTGLTVSDISFGGSRLSDSSLVSYAYDRGVTYFDTAESYRGGASESAVGTALSGVRDKVIIASKTRARAGQDQRQIMSALENSLRRLRTDYVDLYYIHAVNSLDRLENPEWGEFTERAIEQGKIRFRGMSGHGSKLVQCLDYALDQDMVDVVLVAFNFAQDPTFVEKIKHKFHYVSLQPGLVEVLDRARSKGVGVAAMKTLMGARLNDMRKYESHGATFAQAALKWVLNSGRVDVALISMTDEYDIDEYLGASGAYPVAELDEDLLTRYVAVQGSQYCQQGCGTCADSCTYGVPISDVLRTRMYAVDYQDVQLAMDSYANLEGGATACLNCVEQTCLGACPNNIPIASFTRDAAQRFSLA